MSFLLDVMVWVFADSIITEIWGALLFCFRNPCNRGGNNMKLLNRATPGDENFKVLESILEEFRGLLLKLFEGKTTGAELKPYIEELVRNQEPDGMWRMIYSDNMPYESIVEYWKYPTTLFTAVMIGYKLRHPEESAKVDGFEDSLYRALDIVEKGKLSGHGLDYFNFKIKTLKLLLMGGAMEFIEKYPDKHKAFNAMILSSKSEIESALREGKTRFDYDEEFRLRLEELSGMMNGRDEVYLFVYGTLMRRHRPGQTYLDGAEFKGEYVLNGYELYDLGHYPGIVEEPYGKVKGELYAVPREKLPEIDSYEAEGSLYRRKTVKVRSGEGEELDAFAYVYNRSVEGKTKVEFALQPWFEGAGELSGKYVWYACFGSNINKERFMRYIGRCLDNTPPKAEKPYIIKHPVYFAKESVKWDGKGVAFLDTSKKGVCYGKIYLITAEQLGCIQQQEGRWYNGISVLGTEDGIQVKTITHTPRFEEDNKPGMRYIGVIAKGIQDTYPDMTEAEIDAYLMDIYLQKEDKVLLSFLRGQAHGVTIRALSAGVMLPVPDVIRRLHDLTESGLVRQDRANAERLAWNSVDAVYYTLREKRAAIDICCS